MTLHDWLGRHVADPDANHWEQGWFVSRCAVCGRPMLRQPGRPWQMGSDRG